MTSCLYLLTHEQAMADYVQVGASVLVGDWARELEAGLSVLLFPTFVCAPPEGGGVGTRYKGGAVPDNSIGATLPAGSGDAQRWNTP